MSDKPTASTELLLTNEKDIAVTQNTCFNMGLRRGTFRRYVNKVGRNDPCWCKSGKKYKNCHYLWDKQHGLG
jgi:uncharacterized protein YecA (UPF0149 family)